MIWILFVFWIQYIRRILYYLVAIRERLTQLQRCVSFRLSFDNHVHPAYSQKIFIID